MYTAQLRTRGAKRRSKGMIQSAVQSANQAYLNSQVGVTLNHRRPATGSDHGVGQRHAGNAELAEENGEVRSLRDKLAADMVVLVSQDSDWCGYANLMITTVRNGVHRIPMPTRVHSGCLSNQTLAHEVGHLQGLDHDRENKATGSSAYPYSTATGCARRAVSATSCRTTARAVPPDPAVLESEHVLQRLCHRHQLRVQSVEAAEAARTLNDSATKVAAYRVLPLRLRRRAPPRRSVWPCSSSVRLQRGEGRLDRQRDERERLQGRAIARRRDFSEAAGVEPGPPLLDASVGCFEQILLSGACIQQRGRFGVLGHHQRHHARCPAAAARRADRLRPATMATAPPACPGPWRDDGEQLSRCVARSGIRARACGAASTAATVPASVLSIGIHRAQGSTATRFVRPIRAAPPVTSARPKLPSHRARRHRLRRRRRGGSRRWSFYRS